VSNPSSIRYMIEWRFSLYKRSIQNEKDSDNV
jgi:hypothetical protein